MCKETLSFYTPLDFIAPNYQFEIKLTLKRLFVFKKKENNQIPVSKSIHKQTNFNHTL